MVEFWANIDTEDTRSPKSILEEAASQLRQLASTLEPQVVATEVEDRCVLSLRVSNRSGGPTVNLVDAVHRLEFGYPVAIEIQTAELPSYLKEKRFVRPAQSSISTILSMMTTQKEKGRWITNDWVCATPAAFENKLASALTSSGVTATVQNLMYVTEDNESSGG